MHAQKPFFHFNDFACQTFSNEWIFCTGWSYEFCFKRTQRTHLNYHVLVLPKNLIAKRFQSHLTKTETGFSILYMCSLHSKNNINTPYCYGFNFYSWKWLNLRLLNNWLLWWVGWVLVIGTKLKKFKAWRSSISYVTLNWISSVKSHHVNQKEIVFYLFFKHSWMSIAEFITTFSMLVYLNKCCCWNINIISVSPTSSSLCLLCIHSLYYSSYSIYELMGSSKINFLPLKHATYFWFILFRITLLIYDFCYSQITLERRVRRSISFNFTGGNSAIPFWGSRPRIDVRNSAGILIKRTVKHQSEVQFSLFFSMI